LRALQGFAEGPVRTQDGSLSPSALHVQVAGGACVPQQECSLLVHVGEPPAALSIEANSAVSPTAGAAILPGETSAVVQLAVITHGPEAELWLRASRAGRLVARRSVRLPVALGSMALSLEPRVVGPLAVPSFALLGDAGGCVVDLFRLESPERMSWLRTGSSAECTRVSALPVGPLAPGAYRVQVRRDTLSSSTAAVGAFYVYAPGETPAHGLSRLAALAAHTGSVDALVAAVAGAPQAFVGTALGSTQRYLLALLESDLVVYPPAVTGREDNAARQRASLRRVRVFALLALALGGIALALSVGRSGLRASQRAGVILSEAGQDPAALRRARRRSVLAVIASALALLLVFVVVGLYVLARGFFH
jgi:hypothetical protein